MIASAGDVVATVSTALAALAAAVSTWFAWKSIRSSQLQSQSCQVVARHAVVTEDSVKSYLVIENLGPATARKLTATVTARAGGVTVGSHPGDISSSADRQVKVAVDALAPGGSLRRLIFVHIGATSFRLDVALSWNDGTGPRKDRFDVEAL